MFLTVVVVVVVVWVPFTSDQECRSCDSVGTLCYVVFHV
jgi:uncharacterized membrane protein